MLYKDEKFAERMNECLLFKTTEGKMLTLKEYKERNNEKLAEAKKVEATKKSSKQ